MKTLSKVNKTDVVVMVGGKGESMGAVTQNYQKLMLSVDGKPILVHILNEIIDAFGSARVILSTGYRHEDIRSALGFQYRSLDIIYAHDPHVSGTRAGLLLAKNLLHKPFLYLGGDVIAHYSHLRKVVSDFEEHRSEGILGVIGGAVRHDPAPKHGLISTDDTSRITKINNMPPYTWSDNQFRDIHISFFDLGIFQWMSDAPEKFLIMEDVIAYAVEQGISFKLSRYSDRWYHFKKPNDMNVKISFDTPL